MSTVLGKIRTCRVCKTPYQVPSKWPGCCSPECKTERTGKLAKISKTPITPKDRKWLEVRFLALAKYGAVCMLCGSTKRIHVDHIKPQSKFPSLKYDINNLQILCESCNLGKGNRFYDDFRKKDSK